MDKKPEKRRKQPRKINGRYLENAALYYLQRYATSAENFRRVMRRKIDRSCQFHGDEAEPFYKTVDELTERYIKAGLLNDKVFAESRTASLRRQGRSRQDILARLQAKGLPRAEIETALEAVDDTPDAELEAARRLAQKRRIGPYAKTPARDPKEKQREMAVLARGGFSFDIARKALEANEIETTDE